MCEHAHSPICIFNAARLPRAVATAAEARKREKYAMLSRSHHFVPIAIETDALSLLSDIPLISYVHCTPAQQCCLCI